MNINEIQPFVFLFRFIVANLGDRSIPSLKNLIQHLSFKVPDKLDYRNQAAQVTPLFLCLSVSLSSSLYLSQPVRHCTIGLMAFFCFLRINFAYSLYDCLKKLMEKKIHFDIMVFHKTW